MISKNEKIIFKTMLDIEKYNEYYPKCHKVILNNIHNKSEILFDVKQHISDNDYILMQNDLSRFHQDITMIYGTKNIIETSILIIRNTRFNYNFKNKIKDAKKFIEKDNLDKIYNISNELDLLLLEGLHLEIEKHIDEHGMLKTIGINTPLILVIFNLNICFIFTVIVIIIVGILLLIGLPIVMISGVFTGVIMIKGFIIYGICKLCGEFIVSVMSIVLYNFDKIVYLSMIAVVIDMCICNLEHNM